MANGLDIPGSPLSREEENPRSSSEPVQHEIVMAMDMKDNSTIGCAYFSTTNGILQVSEDICTASLDIAEQFLTHAQPSSLLVSARSPTSFWDHLEKLTTPTGGIIFRGLQSSEFSIETAQERLAGLNSQPLLPTGIVFSTGVDDATNEESIPGHPQPESQAFRSLRYGGCINMNSPVSVGCVGALLGDILRRRSAGFLPDGQVAGVLFRVIDIRMFSLSSYILNCTPTLKHGDQIQLRAVRKKVSPFMLRKGIEFPSSGQSFDKGVWGTIHKFTTQALTLRELIGSLNGGSEAVLFQKVIESLQPASMLAVGDMVNKTIDFEQSKARHRSSVKAGIDPQLDELKRQYDGMGSLLTEVVNHIHRELPEWACKHVKSCVFLPQIGFLIAVEPNPATGNGYYEGEGTSAERWEKMFTADDIVCYKNSYMRELDEEYGDMYCRIGDREVEIIHRLASRVLERGEALLLASDMCGEFDAILALALGAEKYNWRAPQVVQASVIHIDEGRHPLQELAVPAFVPNSCHLFTGSQDTAEVQDDSPQALILTGPNHSGKSVYLKQTAIIVYLAHIGSFVPATQAVIGLTESILTCISPRESMTGGESAFARDMKQAALSTRASTPKSLILIDEFGKGTNGDDGAGLLAALLDHYLSLGPDCPRLLAATHFHEIFENSYLNHQSGLRIAHMDVRLDWEAALLDDQVTYLFSLEHGHSTSSFGGRCAALNGVPSAVVDRAESISQLLAQNEDLGAVCAGLSPPETERLEEAEVTARLFLNESFGDEDEVESNEGENGTRDSIEDILEAIISPNT
ncbi:DNA mismatch repair protein msh5 [Fusarium flagelliforme]|uniref:DNA mismatch repair protein MSH5 n=1 Tax=Fusarium flagelliforme TaxID=2675880 RepID=A0A395M7V9_9HYPO|nr:DNA mismatch repair protein msh5 [Fusarium flagelliforme]